MKPLRISIVICLSFLVLSCTQKPADIVLHPVSATSKAKISLKNPYKIIVEKGDTIYRIARKNNVEIRDIIDSNNFRPPYTLIPGQTLKLPKASFHVVGKTDTLYAVSRSYDVDVSRLAQKNKIKPPYNISVGQKLFLPSPTEKEFEISTNNYDSETNPSSSQSRVVSSKPLPSLKETDGDSSPFATAQSYKHSENIKNLGDTAKGQSLEFDTNEAAPFSYKSEKEFAAPVLKPKDFINKTTDSINTDKALDLNNKSRAIIASADTPIIKDKPVISPELNKTKSYKAPDDVKSLVSPKLEFIWPVNGKVISSFGPKSGGLYNDGINISAKEGTKITAAESGDVVYAGNELRGYGNMLLIKHNNGYLTAYAHADDLVVSKGDAVKKGQLIAHIGKTGHVSSPQLHFSIRNGRKAINPEKYLPADFSMISK